MATEMLSKVLAKEQSTAKAEADAEVLAKQKLADAQEEAKKLLADTKLELSRMEAEQLETAQKNAEKAVAVAEDEAHKYVDGLKKNAELKFSEAVGLVKNVISKA